MSTDGDSAALAGQRPLRLVSGTATPEELAALVAVLSAAGRPRQGTRPGQTSRWNAPDRLVRRPVSPGPGAWRASAWPR